MCQEEDDGSNDRLGTVSVHVGSKPHSMLSALMSFQGYFELGIGDFSSEIHSYRFLWEKVICIVL
jgi:hypothetical protein